MKIIAFLFTAFISLQMSGQEKFPDGTPIPDWFRQNEIVNIDTLGKKYTITDYGVANDSTILQTEKIQAVIDRAAENGGGVIIIPKGTFLRRCWGSRWRHRCTSSAGAARRRSLPASSACKTPGARLVAAPAQT